MPHGAKNGLGHSNHSNDFLLWIHSYKYEIHNILFVFKSTIPRPLTCKTAALNVASEGQFA